MTRLVLVIIAVLAIGTVAVLGVRGQVSRRPPVLVFDDMVNQPKYRNQSESPFFADGRQMRLPPAGTVAWGRAAGARDEALLVSDESQYGPEKMPEKLTRQLLLHGQELFNVQCSRCHGEAGNGKGITTGYGMINPPSYFIDRLRQAKDGYLYQVITEGKGLMPAHGPNVKPADRWAIVAYVRALQRAHHATLDDVPEAGRGELKP